MRQIPSSYFRTGYAIVVEDSDTIVVPSYPMTVPRAHDEAVLELISPENTRRSVPLNQSPFLIGRGDAGNQLAIPDRRVSRNCVAILSEGNQYALEDRGNQLGVFLNGEKVSKHTLKEGDIVTFGLENSYQLVFHAASQESTIEHLLTRVGRISTSESSPIGLGKLNLLLEATMLLHSQLPLDAVLEAMLDRAITITNAERGLLLEATRVRLVASPPGPPRRRREACRRRASRPHRQPCAWRWKARPASLQATFSRPITRSRARRASLRSGFAPSSRFLSTRCRARAPTESIVNIQRGQFLGILYLDSKRPAAFSKLDRQILDALAVEAASILDNARLVERERQRQRLEQELSIAREIQQALLPSQLRRISPPRHLSREYSLSRRRRRLLRRVSHEQ